MFLSLLHINVIEDPDRPNPARSWLADIYRVHQRLWMGFPDEHRRAEDEFFLGAWDTRGENEPDSLRARSNDGFLFRVERDGRPRILVQSARKPDWDYAFQNAPYLLGAPGPQVREFHPRPVTGTSYHFRILVNIVSRMSVAHPSGKTRVTAGGQTVVRRQRKAIPIRLKALPNPMPNDPAEQQRLLEGRWEPWRDWLREVARGAGFEVREGPQTPLRIEAAHMAVRRPATTGSRESQLFNAGQFDGVLACTDPERLGNALIRGIGPGKAFGMGLLSLRKN